MISNVVTYALYLLLNVTFSVSSHYSRNLPINKTKYCPINYKYAALLDNACCTINNLLNNNLFHDFFAA